MRREAHIHKRIAAGKILLVALLLFCLCDVHAQSRLPLSNVLAKETPKPLLYNAMPFVRIEAPASSLFIKHELPKGAVFCRMEEKLWHRFNVWIKLRAGSDEAYRQLISPLH